jgi:hypothetical protein
LEGIDRLRAICFFLEACINFAGCLEHRYARASWVPPQTWCEPVLVFSELKLTSALSRLHTTGHSTIGEYNINMCLLQRSVSGRVKQSGFTIVRV